MECYLPVVFVWDTVSWLSGVMINALSFMPNQIIRRTRTQLYYPLVYRKPWQKMRSLVVFASLAFVASQHHGSTDPYYATKPGS